MASEGEQTLRPIVSEQIRVRYPADLKIGEGSIIDDFCYFSTRIQIGRWCHIASGCSIAGGREHTFTVGDLSSLSSGVKVWCSSNDFVRDLVIVGVEGIDIGDRPTAGDVRFGAYTGIGSNSVVMPDNDIPEGVAIGALSYVPSRSRLEPWTVYAGIPIRPIRARDRDRVMTQATRLLEALTRDPKC